MTDHYNKKFLTKIKEAQNDEDLERVIDNIYEDGFQDGMNED